MLAAPGISMIRVSGSHSLKIARVSYGLHEGPFERCNCQENKRKNRIAIDCSKIRLTGDRSDRMRYLRSLSF